MTPKGTPANAAVGREVRNASVGSHSLWWPDSSTTAHSTGRKGATTVVTGATRGALGGGFGALDDALLELREHGEVLVGADALGEVCSPTRAGTRSAGTPARRRRRAPAGRRGGAPSS